jgi:hypothetical protein
MTPSFQAASPGTLKLVDTPSPPPMAKGRFLFDLCSTLRTEALWQERGRIKKAREEMKENSDF